MENKIGAYICSGCDIDQALDVEEITFEPSLATFDMDIMKKMGIEETRTPAKTYWY